MYRILIILSALCATLELRAQGCIDGILQQIEDNNPTLSALRKADRVGLLSSICCSIPSMQPWARNSKVAHRADNMINIRYIFFLINGLMEEAKKGEGKS